ncbi:MAG: hypothetical protein R3E76_09815 [Planctomycetota bacterium]
MTNKQLTIATLGAALLLCLALGYKWLHSSAAGVVTPNTAHPDESGRSDDNSPLKFEPGCDSGQTAGNQDQFEPPPKDDTSTTTTSRYGRLVFDYSLLSSFDGILTVTNTEHQRRLLETPVRSRQSSLDKVFPGPYTIDITGDSAWMSEITQVNAGDTVHVLLKEGTSQTLGVTILEEGSDAPIPFASLLRAGKDSPGLLTEPIRYVVAISDSNGRAELGGQPSVSLEYVVEKHGYEPHRLDSYSVAGGLLDWGVIRLSRAEGTVEVEYDLGTPANCTIQTSLEYFNSRKSEAANTPKGVASNSEYNWSRLGLADSKGSRVFRGLVRERKYIFTLMVIERDADGAISRHATYIVNGVKADQPKIVVSKNDLKWKQR